ncbi:terminase small subunit [Cupriavidus sp. RAF12]|uniref:terminase small subunit n=1 Tax=Cupriavidus sp. RAF12 TaxID=3233050 RepID=UPI003F8E11FA
MALTGKKQKFAEAKGKGMSNKDAAIAAGYSAASAAAAGSRLAKDPDVLAYLDRKKRAKKSSVVPAPVDPELKKVAAAVGFDVTKTFSTKDALEFLIAAFNDPMTEPRLRIDAAKAVVPYQHAKKGEGGKKDAQAEAAKKAAGKFSSLAPPLKVVGGGRK